MYDGPYRFIPQKNIFAACPNMVRAHESKKREDGRKTRANYVSFKSGSTQNVDGALLLHMFHQSTLVSTFDVNLN